MMTLLTPSSFSSGVREAGLKVTREAGLRLILFGFGFPGHLSFTSPGSLRSLGSSRSPCRPRSPWSSPGSPWPLRSSRSSCQPRSPRSSPPSLITAKNRRAGGGCPSIFEPGRNEVKTAARSPSKHSKSPATCPNEVPPVVVLMFWVSDDIVLPFG